MAWSFDDLVIQHQLNVGAGIVPFFGLGAARVRGAAYIEGPMNVGTPFPLCFGAVNIGPLINPDSPPPFIPGGFCYGPPANPFSLAVLGSVGILGDLNVATNAVVGANVLAQGMVIGSCGRHVLALKKDLPFDMPHPNKDGWRLRHVCIEGPEIAVYCRGKIPPNGVIELPSFWDGLVNKEDMSINLTPFGTWQELFVQEIRWGKQVIVRNNLGGPIRGDYHIVARRLDDDLIVEYEGESHEDYPGGNEGYSFNFEHNYVEGLIKDMVKENLNNIEEK
jgi:hypothetical protein|tara:strand:+ start:704 stop:1537 length:834 start_codon:yes stop_codon:yes gene_type:complete